jgi:hypothetical protein
MKYLKYFKESVSENGFDMKYIGLIKAVKDVDARNKRIFMDSLIKYAPTVRYLPNGLWVVKEDISVRLTRLRSLNFKKGNILFFNNGLIKYSTDKGLNFYHAMSGLLDFKEELGFKGSKIKESNDIYYKFYLNIKVLEDHSVFNNIKLNNPEIYEFACNLYGKENIDSASSMTDMGFSD